MKLSYRIAGEISDVTLLIQKLIQFKNKNTIKMYGRFCLELKTFMKHGIRYSYNFLRFGVKDGNIYEDFPARKEYKSINRFLHDLKIYRNELQRKYTEATKIEGKK